jgi:hypothetical protein
MIDKSEKQEQAFLILNSHIRQSTINPDEVMYGGIDHRPRISKRVRGFVFCDDNFLKERFFKSSIRRNISWNIQQCPEKNTLLNCSL